MHHPKKPIKTFKKITVIALLTTVVIVVVSWNKYSPTVANQREIKQKEIIKDISIPPPIVAKPCTLSVDQVKALFQSYVRKIMVQVKHTSNGDVKLVVYGLTDKNEVRTGPFETDALSTGAINVPDGANIGNIEFTRGTCKELFGFRRGKAERIPEARITTPLLFTPRLTLINGHFVYELSLFGQLGLLGIPGNPSPPKTPCTDCDE